MKKEEWIDGVRSAVEELDESWLLYEKVRRQAIQKYITELIQIENHSKHAIKEFIQAEEELTTFEVDQKQKGRIFLSGDYYDQLRKKLCGVICRLNSVANI